MIPRLAVTTKVHERLVEAYDGRKFNVFVLEGSSRSSKTFSIIQFWIKYAWLNRGKKRRVAICRLKGTWLSATVLYDFINVLTTYGLYNKKNHNKTNRIISLWDTEFWFMGLDDPQRVHGFESDAFWINEAIEAGYDDYSQLMQRCKGFAILDYNPSEEFHWIYDRILKRAKTWYSHSTFKDNRFISNNARDQILSYEPTDDNYAAGTADERKWKIYGLGQRASIEGLIFTEGVHWDIVKEVPAWAKRVHRWGLDFGYTNSYTAIPDMYWTGGTNEVWVDEVCYQTGLVNPEIGNILKGAGLSRVKGYADSARPDSIDEIYAMGINVHPVKKIKIEDSLDIMKRLKFHVTERSVNIIKERRNYTYMQDKNGIWLNEPVDNFNHDIDAERYVCTMEFNQRKTDPDRKVKTARALAGIRR